MEIFNEKNTEYYGYLDDIWKRLHQLVIAFVVFFAVGFFGSGPLLRIVVKSFDLGSATLVTTSPFQFFDLAMTVGMYAGFIVCAPIAVYHIYQFLKGGLNRKEKRFFFVLLPIGLVLFCGGFAYGAIVLNLTLDSIASINLGLGIQNFWDIASFLSQIVFTSLLLGLIFQFPIVLTFLVRAGFLNQNFLRNKRRHAIVVMFAVTSLLPPSDGLSLIIMVLPLIVIYEITILVNSSYFFQKAPSIRHITSEMNAAAQKT